MFFTVTTFDTEYPADSVEWCPAEGYENLFVCGTYQLVEGKEDRNGSTSTNSQTRFGRIYLLKVIHRELHVAHTLNTHAVLDMKWSRACFCGDILLGVVNAIGYLQIYRLNTRNELKLELITETRIRENEAELMCLSLDWNTGRWDSDSGAQVQIAVSDSKGTVSLYSFNYDRLEFCGSNKLHDFEAWITAFDYWCPSTVYSGGDDCKFHRLDARMGLQSIGVNRLHGAGVTSIHSNAGKEFVLATGSYDEILRVWDTRNFRQPISEENLHGGIWRLKWDPLKHENLLAACMYGGFCIIDCSAEAKPRIIEEYKEHESIAYGCDWSFLDNPTMKTTVLDVDAKNSSIVATCSFYDHTLKLSTVQFTHR